MAVDSARRVTGYTVLILLVIFASVSAQSEYNLPALKIEVFKPKGYKLSLPYIPNLLLYIFRGNINKPIDTDSTAFGTISGQLAQVPNGRFEYEDRETQLKLGDVINYYLMVSVAGFDTFVENNLSYTVTELKDRNAGRPMKCLPTITRVREGKACGGQVIFEDDFSTFKEDMWQIENYIPISSHPEHPFVSYQDLIYEPVVTVYNGSLKITPILQERINNFDNDTIALGELDFDKQSGCTSRGEECYRKASGADILPPIVSGRITSPKFAFTYGKVHIRAKLPQGDWLYPELLLEPFLKKYGSFDYASGVLKIASALGNKELKSGSNVYGNEVLYGGPIMDAQCRQQLLGKRVLEYGQWGDDFLDYSLTWTPQHISLSVNGEEWAHITAGKGLHARLPRTCKNLPRSKLEQGEAIAPFDDHFYITLGVAAGGITEFPDNSFSTGGRPKPWRNSGRRGMHSFWEDLPAWHGTWTRPELLVDHIKVIAL
ncbi:hypothetical protein evm_006510 [Chilo suppressalis]|nr:hypothetical protein evm_006510 [Chilo suppressalis]